MIDLTRKTVYIMNSLQKQKKFSLNNIRIDNIEQLDINRTDHKSVEI